MLTQLAHKATIIFAEDYVKLPGQWLYEAMVAEAGTNIPISGLGSSGGAFRAELRGLRAELGALDLDFRVPTHVPWGWNGWASGMEWYGNRRLWSSIMESVTPVTPVTYSFALPPNIHSSS